MKRFPSLSMQPIIQASTPHLPEPLQALLAGRRFQRIVVFSGAGMSADSGISTFRSGERGLWTAFDPQQLATPEAWRRDRELVWAWYEWRRGQVMAAAPHAGHVAVAQLWKVTGASIVTQNVDDLHERAGVPETAVLHLHGSLFAPRCDLCGAAQRCLPPALPAQGDGQPPRLAPPVCQVCRSGFHRPGVVWFGETLNPLVWEAARRAVSDRDLLLVVGTSGVVYPAVGLIGCAPADAVVVELNPQAGASAGRIEVRWEETAARGLPVLCAALRNGI